MRLILGLYLVPLVLGCGNVEDFVGVWNGEGIIRNASENVKVTATVVVREGGLGVVEVELPLMLSATCVADASIRGNRAMLESGSKCRLQANGNTSELVVDEGSFEVDGRTADLTVSGWNEQYGVDGRRSGPFVTDLRLRKTR